MDNPERTSPDRGPGRDDGSVLVVVLFLTLGMGAMALAHLTRVVAEERKLQAEYNAERAQVLADGELAIAQNIVNAAPYVSGENSALRAALDSDPPYVPGTSVRVEPVAGSVRWFSLVSEAEFVGATAVAQIMVRDRKPTTSYNYLVVDHPIGISGKPRGLIHSNKTVDFYFPGGEYRERVSAAEGFQWKAGATEDNTQLLGGATQSAQVVDPLAAANIDDAKGVANLLLVEDALEAEITLQGGQATVDLFQPGAWLSSEATGTNSVLSHYETQLVEEEVAIYTTETQMVEQPIWESSTAMVEVSVPIYETQTVEVEVTQDVWVEDEPPPPSELGGGAVAGGSTGHWETVTTTEMQEQTTWTQVGTETVEQEVSVFSHNETQTVEKEVPVYVEEEYTYTEWTWVPRTFVRQEVIGVDGTVFVQGSITSLKGEVSGSMSIVSAGEVRLTGSIQYVDAEGRTAMLNGLDPAAEYEANPDYDGAAVLSVAAAGDIVYARDCPEVMEINAALTSTQGKVAFEDLEISEAGDEVSMDGEVDPNVYVKDSIRRLGGIVSRYRPVATWIGSSGGVLAGFERARTLMDPRLMVGSGGTVTPPFSFEQEEPLWGVRSSGRILGVQD